MIPFIKIKNNLCTGCKLCIYACSAKHYNCFSEAHRIEIDSNEYNGTNKPDICRQCPNPFCRQACPTDAITINDKGSPVIDINICTRCGLCVEKCPFDAIKPDRRGEIVVCDLCDGNPECVKICPSGALTLEVK